MDTQRGNLYVYLGAGIAILALLSGLFFGAKSYLDGVDAKAFKRGQQEAQVAYELRDNKALHDLNEQIVKLQAEIKQKEDKAAYDLYVLDFAYQEEKRNAKKSTDRAIADARSGALRLRDRWRDEADACRAARSRDANATVPGAPGGTDAEGGTELSPELAEFLVSEASRADEIVRKNTALQALIKKYLELVNGRNQEVPGTP